MIPPYLLFFLQKPKKINYTHVFKRERYHRYYLHAAWVYQVNLNHTIIKTVLFLLLIIPITGCINKNTITIDGDENEWLNIPVFIQDQPNDVINETTDTREILELDVTWIKLARDNIYLYVLLEFKHELQYYFNNNREHARNIGDLYFDVDNDNTTGGEAFLSNVTGFDSKLTLNTGVCDKKTGYAMSGRLTLNVSDTAELEYFLEYYPSIYNNSNREYQKTDSKFIESYDKPWLITYKEEYIELKIPLEDLMIPSTSQPVRVLFSERGSGLGEESFTETTGIIHQIQR